MKETTPEPLSMVPFGRDLDFEDCGKLEENQEKSLSPGSRIALVGLGVGKTKLAVELSFRTRENSPETWFLWTSARSADRLKDGFSEIAERLKIHGRQYPEANVFELVINWLNKQENGKWVLVLDNVVSEALPTDDGYQQLWGSLTSSENGSIIITTRNKGIALNYINENDAILIEPMDGLHAMSLMQKRSSVPLPEEDGQLQNLVQELNYMPMAITQAAAYINSRRSVSPVQEYLEYFQTSDRNKVKRLSYETAYIYRDWEESSAILKTLQCSLDQILAVRPSAADLLSVMSFFDPESIPALLLRQVSTMWRGRNSSSGDHFEEDAQFLLGYSLISVTQDPKFYRMRSLVQLATRNWLDINGQTEQYIEKYIDILLAECEHLDNFKVLFPPIQSAASKKPTLQSSLPGWALVLHEGAEYAWKEGNLPDMKRMARKATWARETVFGPEDERTMASFNLLAFTQENTRV
ncbi:uncharacterized protein PGRI_096050 [Penicillium griseofulvum]|uniref:Uncharacterized protein n=1 Tax=Penicillium patulum TaxID=5078 RepID=A0A135L804_PENPA|nr:uncharacterized protein PGRI_096050 [Penicillium griseofulvum]KXG45118.1 hypothetical protein PGRI_096050 [Penicillium griseofulvum]